MNSQTEEILALAGRQLEDRLSADDEGRLHELLIQHPELVDVYTDLLSLHAQLSWDAGMTVPPVTSSADLDAFRSNADQRPAAVGRTRRIAAVVGITAAMAVLWFNVTHRPTDPPAEPLAENADAAEEIALPAERHAESPTFEPIQLAHQPRDAGDNRDASTDQPNLPESIVEPRSVEWLAADFSDADVIHQLDQLLQASWEQAAVTVSEPADDAEWIRRAYLSFIGRIPTLAESESFLASDGPRRKDEVLHSLINSQERSDYFATVWTNLLVGRTEKRTVNREMLFDFMADQFDRNVPWIDTVSELITATGRNDENGATNFLLAHLNNQATPATAVTARLFLGEQISCVQCHDHPFSKSVRQEDYWALNAFFKDTVRVQEPERSPASRYLTCRLVDRTTVERITHFETLSGQQRAVLPRYDGTVLPESSSKNRRKVLAGLLSRDSNTRIARAMVNRMWAHFFGYGFTNPIDDMGSHSIVSHPQILDLLTEAFAKSDYDLRRLSLWISASKAWQLSSAMPAKTVDLPEHGDVPMFTRVYPRRMSPEQVYESVRVAIRSSAEQPLQHTAETLDHRRRWVQQFAEDYETDENDESLNFGGTISQALVMMNGAEVERAVRQAARAIVQAQADRGAPDRVLRRVSLAAVTRLPTEAEQRAFRTHLRQLSRRPSPESLVQAVEDMLWAYLNSSEFVLIH